MFVMTLNVSGKCNVLNGMAVATSAISTLIFAHIEVATCFSKLCMKNVIKKVTNYYGEV